jgi:hypothetical protein
MEPDDGSTPFESAGMTHGLEARLAKEAIEVWSAWRDGTVPTSEDESPPSSTTPRTTPICRSSRTHETNQLRTTVPIDAVSTESFRSKKGR